MVLDLFSPGLVTVLWALLGALVLIVLPTWLMRKGRGYKHLVDLLPGPPAYPLVGNMLAFTNGRDAAWALMKDNAKNYFPIFRTWQATLPVIHPLHPDYIEKILTSSIHITKSHDYRFLNDWLGKGLLLSTGAKWHKRRKMLTPTFHFSILEQFLTIFSEKSKIMIKRLGEHVGNPDGVNIVPLVTHCALDIICETAMGKSINAQEQSGSEYVSAVYDMNELIFYRVVRPWLYPKFIFNLTAAGRKYKTCLEILHGFTNRVIQERKEERKKYKPEQQTQDSSSFEGRKRKTAFLDLLMAASEQDGGLTDEDIREEVDTFMFEGHDTTANGMSWTLFLLGAHPEIQEKCVTELREIFGDSDRLPTMSDVNNMKYLERVIKETLRVRPSVPSFGRELTEPINLGGYDLPAGAKINVHVYDMHNNPKFFPNPEKFDPDRFLPENCVGRHPFAYIPFSAGPRNCIGQKFAMLEMKSCLSTILRNFRFESVNPELYSEAIPDLILRPMHGLVTKFYPRVETGLVQRVQRPQGS